MEPTVAEQYLKPTHICNKQHQYVLDEVVALFTEPKSQIEVSGVLVENAPLQKIKELWLRTPQGEDFLLEGNYNAYRYPHLERFMKTSEVVWAPTMKLYGNDALYFIQGRHRCLWHLVHKYEKMTIAVAPFEADQVRKLLDMQQ